MLTGQTVSLRPLEPRHVELSLRWMNDPEVARMLGLARPVTHEEGAAWQRRAAEDAGEVLFAVEMLQEGRHVGNGGFRGIDWRVRKAEFWLMIGDKGVWGHGVGLEAARLLLRYGFHWLNLNRIWLACPEYNDRAMRLCQKCGFKPEGQLREDVFQDGRLWSTVRLGILRSEWKA